MNIKGKPDGITSRPYQGEDDFWRVRDLIIETYPITPPDFNWEIRRWDGAFYYNEEAGFDARWGRFENFGIQLWETGDGRLIGAVHPEGGQGDAFIQVHPDFRHIEGEMIDWAEGHLAVVPGDDPRKKVYFFAYEYDVSRQALLEKKGYEKVTSGGVIRRIVFDEKAIPKPDISDGYSIRTLRPDDMADCKRYSDTLNAAFKRDCHTAKELHTFVSKSPSYRNDLDLIAEAPDGSIASIAAMIYDEDNRFGLFEPVCTHPDHVRKGLANSLMFEGLHRVKALGATVAYVGTGDQPAANALYESIGFTEKFKGYYWKKPL